MTDSITAPRQLFTLHTTGTSFHVLELYEGGNRTFCVATSDMDSYTSTFYSPAPRWQPILDGLLAGNPFLLRFLAFQQPEAEALSEEEREEFRQWKAGAERRILSDGPKSALAAVASHDRGHFTKEFAWIRAKGELSVFHARILAWFAKATLEGACVYLFVDFGEIQPPETAMLFLDLVERELPRFPTRVLYVSPQRLGVRDPVRFRWVTSAARARELALKWWRYTIPDELGSEVG